MEDTTYRIICPDCRLELNWLPDAWAEWRKGTMQCPRCLTALRDMHADMVAKKEREPMTEERFNEIADMFQLLVAKPEDEVYALLVNAGWARPSNMLDAVMNNLRRVYGEQEVMDWLKACGYRGILV
jgi:uncharacterized Zn finger protein (UPF0148 family)